MTALMVGDTRVTLADPDTLDAMDEPEEQWAECTRYVWCETSTGALWYVPAYKVHVIPAEAPEQAA